MFSWQFMKTAKLILLLLDGIDKLPRKPTFFLAVQENRQENIQFPWGIRKTAKELTCLCGLLFPPRICILLGGSILAAKKNFDRQGKPSLV
jgi:hypothetical protein